MDSNINPMNTGTLALLNDVSKDRYHYGFGPYASPAANAVRLEKNQQAIEDQNDCTRGLLMEAFNGIRGSFENGTRASQLSSDFTAEVNPHRRELS